MAEVRRFPFVISNINTKPFIAVETASPLWVGLCCAALAIITLITMLAMGTFTSIQMTLITSVAYAIPGIFYEYQRIYGWALPQWRQVTINTAIYNSVLKTFGLIQILAVAGFLFSILPEYKKDLYKIWQDLYVPYAVGLAVISPLYFLLCEYTVGSKNDIYKYIGRFSLFIFFARVWTRPILRQGLLLWIVKLFFLPIMLGSVHYGVVYFVNHPINTFFNDYYRFFDMYWELILALDVVLAVAGYTLSLRFLGTAVISTDPTWRGWIATLICYFPFSSALYGSYLTYEDGLRWGNIIPADTIWYYAYGLVLLSVHTLYLCASLNFGIRYSNLSHRGILTDGLFRLTKHPAYLFKNIGWWMIGLPFISHMGLKTAIANCLLLGGVNIVYWWRARTEEKHLSRDPRYVAYALAMNERSLLAFLGRWFPVLQYRVPTGYQRLQYRITS